MQITSEKYEITMSQEELWATAFDIRRVIIFNIETHWVKYQNSWEKEEKDRIERCKTMFGALQRLDVIEDIYHHAKNTFEAYNKKEKV